MGMKETEGQLLRSFRRLGEEEITVHSGGGGHSAP
jgi:hypothetical protein